MCDIDNPLYGDAGAAAVFAPQKGADAAMVARLDAGLRHLGQVAARCLGRDFSHLPGAGAAGGLGFGMAAFCGAQLRMGIDAVLDAVGFDSLLPGTDMVFTGEGKIDSQSARGKVVSGVAARCRKAGVPVGKPGPHHGEHRPAAGGGPLIFPAAPIDFPRAAWYSTRG